MKNSLKKSISVLMIILMFGLVITGCVENKPNTLTQAQKIEDFEYMYKIIEENYPFLEVNKRVNGVDWLAKKDEFLEEIKKCKNDEEFDQTLNNILSQLNNDHTHIVNKKIYEYLFPIYSNLKGGEGYYKELAKPIALKRYNYDINKKETKTLNESVNKFSTENNIVTKRINDNIAYMGIKSFDFYNLEKDREIIKDFYKDIKSIDALIIDIRGNGGGSHAFWIQNIISPLIEETLSTNFCYFTRGGEFAKKFYLVDNWAKVQGNEQIKGMKELPPEIVTDFEYYYKEPIIVKPKNSVNFKGKVFLLVDKNVFSASEAFAVFTKESGFATLIGETTGGDGLAGDPAVCTLPNSGLVFRFSYAMGTNESGVCNEEFKTVPNYIVDAEITENIEDDKCIQKAIELVGKEK